MKQIISVVMFFFLLTLPLFSFGQIMPKNDESGKYEYLEVVESSGSQQELYVKVKKWCSSYFENENFNYDRDFKIIMSGYYSYSIDFIMRTALPIPIKYDLSITSKDQKYKLVINNFMYEDETVGKMGIEDYMKNLNKKYYPAIEEPLDIEIKKVIASLKYYIENGVMQGNEDDW